MPGRSPTSSPPGRSAQRAVDSGLLTNADRRRWLDDLTTGWTNASVTLFMVAATKAVPGAD